MESSIRPRRSVLYIPGSNERALEKARTIPADVLILDLEDAVSPDVKAEARDAVSDAVLDLAEGRREIVVRVNALDTPWIARDLAAMASARPDAILVPKISRTDDIRRVRSALTAADAPRDMHLWAMIETTAAVLNAPDIAAIASMPAPPLTCFVLGTNDLAVELRAAILPGREALIPHIAHVLAAARAHGLNVIDGTFNDMGDDAGLQTECEQSRNLGLDGKSLIHPVQVQIANRAMAPSESDVAWSRRVVEAFSAQENAGRGVIKVGRRMVERLHEREAQRILDIDAAIRALEDDMRALQFEDEFEDED